MAFAAAVLVAWRPMAYSAERATLSNGFAMACDHHAWVDGKLRLYLSAGESSYIEMRRDEVKEFEQVPDETASANAMAKPATKEAKLSPADLQEMMNAAGRQHNVDVDLLASIVKAESGGNAHAVSRAGARGLMQLMPATASDMGVQDSFAAQDNVQGGSTYLDSLLMRYHDNLSLALAAYNAGPVAVDRYHGIPPYHETQAYVARVIHEFNRRVRAREMKAKQLAKAKPANAGVTAAASAME